VSPDPGDLLELEAGAVATGGGCVARAPDGRVVFVRHTLPGERVRAVVTSATTSYLRADAVEVLVPSPERVEPPCPYAGPGRCGGCDYQHVALGTQRSLKAYRVAEQLRRVAGMERLVEVEPVPAPDGDEGLRWRTRLRLAVDRDGRAGFHRHRSHDVEPVTSCPIAAESVMATGVFARRWPGATELDIVTGDGGDQPASDAVVTVVPRRPGSRVEIPDEDDVRAGISVGQTVCRPPAAVHCTVGGHTFRISAGVFWQGHAGAPAALLGAVMDLVGPCAGASVVDLYAGAGLFSVPLASAVGPSGRVLAVERAAGACDDLRHNAARAGHARANCRVLQATVTPELIRDRLGRPDVLVLDPARDGAGTAVTRAIAAHASSLRTVVYVACDPASFSRDCRVLLDDGWTMRALRAFDIFPMTEHVELVAAFTPPAAS
jgi:tRNA/tmRNA/rRNA uracil-C5-methylase (TrmA/RlmC/RlmD family)